MVEIVNIVGSGELEVEIDLEAVAEHADLESFPEVESIEHSRRQGNRINVRFNDGPLGILAPSGVYVITGAKSYDSLYKHRDALLDALRESSVVPDADSEGFTVQNVVCVGELETGNIDLNHLTIILGLENVEYEPEQFPGLVYRPEESSCVLLIFASGKVVITGAKSEDEATEAFENFEEHIQSFQLQEE